MYLSSFKINDPLVSKSWAESHSVLWWSSILTCFSCGNGVVKLALLFIINWPSTLHSKFVPSTISWFFPHCKIKSRDLRSTQTHKDVGINTWILTEFSNTLGISSPLAAILKFSIWSKLLFKSSVTSALFETEFFTIPASTPTSKWLFVPHFEVNWVLWRRLLVSDLKSWKKKKF